MMTVLLVLAGLALYATLTWVTGYLCGLIELEAGKVTVACMFFSPITFWFVLGAFFREKGDTARREMEREMCHRERLAIKRREHEEEMQKLALESDKEASKEMLGGLKQLTNGDVKRRS